MRVVKPIVLLCLFCALGLLSREARAVHTGADAHCHVHIGYPDVQEVTIYDHDEWPIYSESHAHTTLYYQGNKAAEAEGHARRLHIDLPWPLPDVIWTDLDYGSWLTDGGWPKHAGAKASAWGSQFIVDGPPGEMVQVRARISAPGSLPPEYVSSRPVSQGMYADSFFDVFFDVSLAIRESPTSIVTLLDGSARLYGPEAATPGLVASGDLAGSGYLNVTDVISPPGEPRKLAVVDHDIVSSLVATVPTNTPFESFFDVFGESLMPEEPITLEGREVGAAGAFIVQLELVDQSGAYNLRGVSEPGTLALLAAGFVALLAHAWRHRRS